MTGCLNGGAQIRSDVDGRSGKDLVSLMKDLYGSLPSADPRTDPDTLSVYSQIVRNHKDKLFTSYKAVEKNLNPLGIKW